ncbi:hypothetical protein LA080_013752 [Diaporthe eres]|uniref:2EXR domain-containing protein n=1 Tax=Diaporthe vaccinii TaxID=105482 RepID=A0ABR4ETL3_9PEZI|nr:hypothetical protein LA080_013752 [Diaporthe eres]
MEGVPDTKDVADKEQPKDSPLFTKLPPELRLQIYNEVFEGSRTTYKQNLVIGHRTYRNILSPTDHRNFLLNCRKAYNEAHETYWNKTILYGDPGHEDLAVFLRSVVPDFAKPHLNNIRDLCGRDDVWFPVPQCLEEFPNLQTIGFRIDVTFNPLNERDGIPLTIQEQVQDFFKGTGHSKGMTNLIPDSLSGPSLACFYNYSTQKILYVDSSTHIDDEEACFAMVLDNQAPAEEARQEI